jgi:HTH-type transcriptional regulator/antitoxin HipB
MSDRTSAATQIGQLGVRLRDRRRALGLTQEEVAELAETTQRFVSTLETGKSTVRLDKVVDVADVLGLMICLQDRDDGRMRAAGIPSEK